MQRAAPAIDGRRPRVLIAPDKFKGTFSAAEVAALVGAGFTTAGWAVEQIPVADGGEGTADVLLGARGGERIVVPVVDPLGRPVEASYARLADGRTAVLDMASASGLWRLRADELDPLRATTAGTGMLVRHALDAGATRIVVAAGGSATVDGGRGAVEEIGALPEGVRIVVACDVRTRWEDAAAVFGPQKGAGAEQVEQLERRLDALAERAPRDPRGVPRTGAAGGLSGGLWAWLGAEMVSGADLVLDALGLRDAVGRADLVVTGEGRIDDQTLAGKAVEAVAALARGAGVPCVAVVGKDALSAGGRETLGLAAVLEAGTAEALRAVALRFPVGS